ncbi:transposase [Xanthomonas campestris pv. phormiicola]|nr:transposase [Xanthomonas campestris pv. phormiicola]
MLRMYFVQHWLDLGDEACEKALLDSTALQRLVGTDLGRERVPSSKSRTGEEHELQLRRAAWPNLHLAHAHLKRSLHMRCNSEPERPKKSVTTVNR